MLLVGLGGAVGAVLRYLLTVGMFRYLGLQLWLGIMLVNVVGCLLIGLCAAGLVLAEGAPGPMAVWLARISGASAEATMERGHLLFMTGLLGGFTTFSTAMLDVYVLWRLQNRAFAMWNLFLTPILGLLAVMAGLRIGGGI